MLNKTTKTFKGVVVAFPGELIVTVQLVRISFDNRYRKMVRLKKRIRAYYGGLSAVPTLGDSVLIQHIRPRSKTICHNVLKICN